MNRNLEAQVLETLKSTNIALKFHLCQWVKLKFSPLFYATNKKYTDSLYIVQCLEFYSKDTQKYNCSKIVILVNRD